MSTRIAVPRPDTLLNDRYRLVRRLGAGGMGSVWEAEDLVLQRSVAVKLVHGAQQQDQVVLARFAREARTAARLHHPHLAMVYDYGESPEGLYLVLELLEGETLADRLRKGALPPEEAADVVAQVAAALAVAHAAGVVHRDIKPANLMLTEGGAKVMDFGIATGDGDALTATGLVIGTAAYLAPERVRGEAAGPAADVYALGVVLHECLRGAPAFVGDTPAEVADAQLHEEAPDLALVEPPLPAEIVALCRAALEKDAGSRPTADEMVARLSGLPGIQAPSTDEQHTAPLPVTVPVLAAPASSGPSTTTSTAVAPVGPSAARPAGMGPTARWAIGALVVAVALVAALVYVNREEDPGTATLSPTPTTVVATTAPALAPPQTVTTAATAAPTTVPSSVAPEPPATSSELGAAAVDYVRLLDAGDFEAAWAATSPAFQAAQDQDGWQSFWSSFDTIEVVGDPQVDEAARSVVVPLSFDGQTENYRLTLVPGGDGWLVDGPVGG